MLYQIHYAKRAPFPDRDGANYRESFVNNMQEKNSPTSGQAPLSASFNSKT